MSVRHLQIANKKALLSKMTDDIRLNRDVHRLTWLILFIVISGWVVALASVVAFLRYSAAPSGR